VADTAPQSVFGVPVQKRTGDAKSSVNDDGLFDDRLLHDDLLGHHRNSRSYDDPLRNYGGGHHGGLRYDDLLGDYGGCGDRHRFGYDGLADPDGCALGACDAGGSNSYEAKGDKQLFSHDGFLPFVARSIDKVRPHVTT
jgi:hypothetical protein